MNSRQGNPIRMKERILVTDGEQRSALACVRSLGRAGFEVLVAASAPGSLAGASRYASEEVVLPDPLKSPREFAAGIERVSAERFVALVLPVTEASVLATLENVHTSPPILPLSSLESFLKVSDKRAVLDAALAHGISVPSQIVLEDPGGLEQILMHLQFPIVLKPSRSVRGQDLTRMKFGVSHALTREELRTRIASLPAAAFPLLLQQRIVGPGIGVFLLIWEGRLVAAFSHRRIREKPPSGGVSVYRESVPMDSGLLEKSRALLDGFGWRGAAMIEYKVDAATGAPYIMEINGRLWGSLQLAIDSGVDFPRLLVEAALGRRPEPVLRYQTHVRSRWWWGDIDQLLARMTKSATELTLPPGSPGRLVSLARFLRIWWPGDRSEVFRWSDPKPGILETQRWFLRR